MALERPDPVPALQLEQRRKQHRVGELHRSISQWPRRRLSTEEKSRVRRLHAHRHVVGALRRGEHATVAFVVDKLLVRGPPPTSLVIRDLDDLAAEESDGNLVGRGEPSQA